MISHYLLLLIMRNLIFKCLQFHGSSQFHLIFNLVSSHFNFFPLNSNIPTKYTHASVKNFLVFHGQGTIYATLFNNTWNKIEQKQISQASYLGGKKRLTASATNSICIDQYHYQEHQLKMEKNKLRYSFEELLLQITKNAK